jgi:outer membrane protein TolC
LAARALTAGVAAFWLGCVPADAGYEDVRKLTAERLKKDVRWYEHDSAAAAEEHTQKLLSAPLDADAAVQLALLNSQALQAQLQELGIARARLVSALRLPNPTVSAALHYNVDDTSDTSLEAEALIDLSALIFLPIQGGAAGEALDAAALNVTGQVLDLAFRTRISFFEYQAAQQTLELRRSILAALAASFEVAQQLHQAGNITDLSLASERALYEEARVAFTGAEARARARREQLNAQLGLWGSRAAAWQASDRLAAPERELDTAELEVRAIQRSLDLELSRKRFAAAAKSSNLQSVRGWLPELRGGVSAQREIDSAGHWDVGPAIEVEIPLFYQGQGERGVALAEMRQEQRRHADAAIRVRAAARAASSRLEAASKNATYYREVLLPLRQQIVDETQLQFNAMSVGVFQLLQAKRDQIETARAYVDALLEYWTARTQVEQLLAGRLPADAPPVAETSEANAGRGGSEAGH